MISWPTVLMGQLFESVRVAEAAEFFRFSYPVNGGKDAVFLKVVTREADLTYFHWEYIDGESSYIDYIPLFYREGSDEMVRVTQGLLGLKRNKLATYFSDCPDLANSSLPNSSTTPMRFSISTWIVVWPGKWVLLQNLFFHQYHPVFPSASGAWPRSTSEAAVRDSYVFPLQFPPVRGLYDITFILAFGCGKVNFCGPFFHIEYINFSGFGKGIILITFDELVLTFQSPSKGFHVG